MGRSKSRAQRIIDYSCTRNFYCALWSNLTLRARFYFYSKTAFLCFNLGKRFSDRIVAIDQPVWGGNSRTNLTLVLVWCTLWRRNPAGNSENNHGVRCFSGDRIRANANIFLYGILALRANFHLSVIVLRILKPMNHFYSATKFSRYFDPDTLITSILPQIDKKWSA